MCDCLTNIADRGLPELRKHLFSAGDAADLVEHQLALAPSVGVEGLLKVHKFFMCVIKNRCFRRLCRWGGCGSKASMPWRVSCMTPLANSVGSKAFWMCAAKGVRPSQRASMKAWVQMKRMIAAMPSPEVPKHAYQLLHDGDEALAPHQPTGWRRQITSRVNFVLLIWLGLLGLGPAAITCEQCVQAPGFVLLALLLLATWQVC